jgi:hypothetical protein
MPPSVPPIAVGRDLPEELPIEAAGFRGDVPADAEAAPSTTGVRPRSLAGEVVVGSDVSEPRGSIGRPRQVPARRVAAEAPAAEGPAASRPSEPEVDRLTAPRPIHGHESPTVGTVVLGSQDPVHRHVVRPPAAFRRPSASETAGGSAGLSVDATIGSLARLLATPIGEAAPDDTESAQASGQARGESGAQAPRVPDASDAGHPELRLVARPAEERGARAGLRERGSRLAIGRVEVHVENRTPPPVLPARAEPVTVPVDPLERHFLDRFRLRP